MLYSRFLVAAYMYANVHFLAAWAGTLWRTIGILQNSNGDVSIDRSVRRLLTSASLINQAVGDALSDLLFCEAVLRLKGWGCEVNI